MRIQSISKILFRKILTLTRFVSFIVFSLRFILIFYLACLFTIHICLFTRFTYLNTTTSINQPADLIVAVSRCCVNQTAELIVADSRCCLNQPADLIVADSRCCGTHRAVDCGPSGRRRFIVFVDVVNLVFQWCNRVHSGNYKSVPSQTLDLLNRSWHDCNYII